MGEEGFVEADVLGSEVLLLDDCLSETGHVRAQSAYHSQPDKVQFHLLYQFLLYLLLRLLQVHPYITPHYYARVSRQFHLPR